MARLAGPLHASGALARGDRPLPDYLTDADLPPDRRDYRSGDDVIGCIDRERAQQGLPLLLQPRPELDAIPTAALGLTQRRGSRIRACGSRAASHGISRFPKS